jgi:hypothetical protein
LLNIAKEGIDMPPSRIRGSSLIAKDAYAEICMLWFMHLNQNLLFKGQFVQDVAVTDGKNVNPMKC